MSGAARVWVTGVGLMTPLGTGVEPTWTRLVRGDRAIAPVTLFDASGYRAAIAAEVSGVVLPGGSRDVAAAWSRTSVMAVGAADEAMRMAGLDAKRLRTGLVVGATTGGMFETERLLASLHAEPERREALVEMLSHPITATTDRLNERLGPFLRARTLSSACSSGANAIAIAAEWVLRGDMDAVVAGGSDGLCRLTLAGFNALSALDPEPCRPFDKRRRGTSLGEGAGFLVLERSDRARARGASPIVELAGWAIGSEAHHITNPDPEGTIAGALIALAIARAGLVPADVDYVNAHGTGTLANDAMESAALRRALGGEATRVPVSSSKAQIGHTLGAAGAIEAAITALVVARRTLVPTAGLGEPDPALGLVHVPHVGQIVTHVRAALSSSFGFGGMDSVLVFTEPRFVYRDAHGDAGRGARVTSSDETEIASLVGPAHPAAVVTGVAVFGPCGRLGAEGCAGLVDGRPRADDVAGVPVDPDAYLDPARARRLDRPALLGTVAVEYALADAAAPRSGTGVVLGSAFGNVDASAAFMHRIFEKGPRAASPAEFPNLVPSSPVGHVSIYTGLRGPALATADLATSGESAFAQATELLAGGLAERVVAGAIEPASHIVDRVLAALFARVPTHPGGPRQDLAVAVVVEDEAAARRRGARRLARVVQVLEWRGDGAAAMAEIEGPRGGSGGTAPAEVILARPNGGADALIAQTPWKGCARRCSAPSLGESDALGAVAIAVAAARVGRGLVSSALVVGLAKGRGYAIVLESA